MKTKTDFFEPSALWLGGVKSAAIVLLIMLLSTTTTAWAAKGDVVATGTCGDNLTWTLTENGEADFTYNSKTYTPLTLTITGTGAMTDYARSGDTPWWSNSNAITHLELPEGLTHVGNHAFGLNYFIQSVTLPASVTSIGESAFRSVGSHTSNGCTFTAAKGSKLTSIATEAFMKFGGNVDLRNCTSLTIIGKKVFEDYKTNTVYLPISIRTIKKDAFYSTSIKNKPTVRVSYKNSVLYVNDAFKAFSTKAMNTVITSFLNLKVQSSDAVSICQIFPDEIKLAFDESDHSFIIANEQDFLNLIGYYSQSFDTYQSCEGIKFKMINDLDFSNISFFPIGRLHSFVGHFDGQGHTISGLYYAYPSNYYGLFGCVDGANTIIENVTLINPVFKCSSDNNSTYAGGIVGLFYEGTIRNCNVVGGSLSNVGYAGGIVGNAHGDWVKSIVDCTVVGTTINGERSGCVVGYNDSGATTTISNCLYDVVSNENICSSQFTNGGGNTPLYRLNLGFGVTSDALTYGDYTVATKGTTVNLDATASREWYDFAGFKSDDVTINNGQFTMPAESVNVEINWEAQENISVKASLVNGIYWTTFYCGDAGYYILEDEEAFAYTATVRDDEIILHSLGKYIPKGSAVIIAAEDNSISMKRDDYGYPDFSVDNDLKGVDEPTPRTFLTSDDSNTLYMLSNKNKNFGFHDFAGTNVPARKAYFTVPASAEARSFSMAFDDETTAIKDLNIKNNESVLYDLSGRLVSGRNLKRGIYVKNGKKMVIK